MDDVAIIYSGFFHYFDGLLCAEGQSHNVHFQNLPQEFWVLIWKKKTLSVFPL